MRIVFFGTPGFAVPSLDALMDSGHDIIAVVTQPDRRSGRGRRLVHSPVKERALQVGLRIFQPVRVGDEDFINDLKRLAPSVIIVVAYGQILPKDIIDLPIRGCINVHASLLPQYRGAAPINWVVIEGGKMTGITTMLMDEGMDTGPVLLKKEVVIREEETAGSLTDSLSKTGAETLIRTLEMVELGGIKPVPQSGEISYAPQLKKTDGLIRWSRPAEELFNLIRGTNPWPGAYTFLEGERIKILKALPIDGEGEDGIIIKTSKSDLFVGTGNGLLSVLEIQRPGRPAAGIKAFLQGGRLLEGMRFYEEPGN
jgi:methionyl-tRNA formyltransferase